MASKNIENEDVLILKNHGIICVGKNLKEAKLLAVFVEETANMKITSFFFPYLKTCIHR